MWQRAQPLSIVNTTGINHEKRKRSISKKKKMSLHYQIPKLLQVDILLERSEGLSKLPHRSQKGSCCLITKFWSETQLKIVQVINFLHFSGMVAQAPF